MNGFVNVLKPTGLTSSDAVSRLKRFVRPNKIGHMGTLDPAASGVLPVAIGKATRLFDFLLGKVKTYRACFVFGTQTDTLDSMGKITDEISCDVSINQVEQTIKEFVGEIQQIPPAYSAISINGQRAYDLARKGIEFDIKSKKVEIYEFKLLNQISKNTFIFDIKCSGGTYIRSIVRDLAHKLGTCGYMSWLIRTQCGNFSIENALRFDEIEQIENHLISVESVLEDCHKFEVDCRFYEQLKNGVKLSLNNLPIQKEFIVYCKNELFGLGKVDEQSRLVVETNLRDC